VEEILKGDQMKDVKSELRRIYEMMNELRDKPSPTESIDDTMEVLIDLFQEMYPGEKIGSA